MNKLEGKDLITVGIYTAIYFVVLTAISMLGFIPIFLVLLSVLVPIVDGIPMMLYYSKIKKFGMLTITGLLCGLLMMLTGMGYYIVITGIVIPFIADLILKAGKYTSVKMMTLSYGVFSMWLIGNYIPIFVARDSYRAELVAGYGQEYADTLMRLLPNWMVIVLLVAGFVAGIIGAVIGQKVFKKHFERAGIV